LPSLYTACDVFFLPSVREVLALVALEAMRFSRPVIVTDRILCAPELVEDGVTGWIVNPGRPEDGAEKLIRLSRDRDLGKRMGKKGHERSLAYTLPAVTDQLERCYAGSSDAQAAPAPFPKTEIHVDRRETCVLCGRGTFAQSRESNVLSANARQLPEEFFRMWRCPVCLSLHSLANVPLDEFKRRSPYLKRTVNRFNRRMFEGFYRFLGREGLRPEHRLLFYGLNAELFKGVFEKQGQSPVDIVDQPLSPDAMAENPAGGYDAAVVMEYLECAEDPRLVFGYVARQLRPGGLLIVHTPDAERIALTPNASQRLYQPHRIHILSRLLLDHLANTTGFRTRAIYRRNYMDTPWPFINFRAFHELAKFGDGTLDAAIEFRPEHLRLAWWRWPRLAFWGLLGGLFRDRSNLIGIFIKEEERGPA
jgi:hypothetical protein